MNKMSNIPLCFDLITIDENIIVGNEFVRRFSQSLAFCPYKKRMREEKTLKLRFSLIMVGACHSDCHWPSGIIDGHCY